MKKLWSPLAFFLLVSCSVQEKPVVASSPHTGPSSYPQVDTDTDSVFDTDTDVDTDLVAGCTLDPVELTSFGSVPPVLGDPIQVRSRLSMCVEPGGDLRGVYEEWWAADPSGEVLCSYSYPEFSVSSGVSSCEDCDEDFYVSLFTPSVGGSSFCSSHFWAPDAFNGKPLEIGLLFGSEPELFLMNRFSEWESQESLISSMGSELSILFERSEVWIY